MKKIRPASWLLFLGIILFAVTFALQVNEKQAWAEDTEEAVWCDDDSDYEEESDDEEETEEEYYEINLKQVSQISLNQVKLTWEIPESATAYFIYRSTGNEDSFTKIGEISGGDVSSWTDSTVKYGKTYYYKITFIEYGWWESDYSKSISVKIGLMAPSVKAETAGVSSIKISWSQKPAAIYAYEIYRSSEKNGEYQLVNTVTDTTTSWVDTGKKIGVTWYYRMKAVVNNADEVQYSDFSSPSGAYANVTKPTISSLKAKNGNAAVLTWGKVSGAKGYEIYMCKKKSGTYKRVKKITSGKTTKATKAGLTNATTYYFKIRAYCTSGGKTWYSSFSSIKSRIIDTYGYAGESYTAKCKRIFGCNYYKEYKSEKAAKKHMTKIRIKTWDINSKGKKYTRYWTCYVNKNIAATVERIFAKIYKGKEKFPIHSLGIYSWRGSDSTSEHCEGLAIDINPDENYFYDFANKKILSGKLYKPGKNAYSIRANGDVVKAMNQYGFSWGLWSTKSDYMHFSYFGT